eukprot:500570_1
MATADKLLKKLIDTFENEITVEQFILKQYVKTLPISIQRIVEWAQQLIVNNKVNDIDFDEIDKDLKQQYKNMNGDETKLKNLFQIYKTENNLIFYDGCSTVIHFIFYMFTDKKYNGEWDHIENSYTNVNRNKRVFIGLRLLKLFLENKCISTKYQLERHSMHEVLVTINGNLQSYWKVKTSTEIICTRNLQEFIKILMFSMKQTSDKPLALLGVVIRAKEWKFMGKYQLNVPFFNEFAAYGQSYHSICYDIRIVEQLLFMGVIPFSFHDIGVNVQREYLEEIIIKFKVCDEQHEDVVCAADDIRHDGRDELFILIPLIISAPLMLLPYLNKCKSKMKQILSQSLSMSIVSIQNMIVDYIYVDYNNFYSVEMQNNLNMQSMAFIAHLIFLDMNQQFVETFKQKYKNKVFIKYLIDNYSKWTAIAIKKCDVFNMDIIYSLIEMYNNDKHKYPLYGRHGLLSILTKLTRIYKFNSSEKTFIDLLSLIKRSYGDEFDYKFTFDDRCSHGSHAPILLFRAFWHRDI